MESQPQNHEFRNNPEILVKRFLVLKGLSLCRLGNFSCLCCHLLTFSKLTFSIKTFFQYHYQSVKLFGECQS